MLPRCVARLHLHSGKHSLVEGIPLCSQLYRRCVTVKDSDPPAMGTSRIIRMFLMLQSFLISGSRSFLSPGPSTVPSLPSPSLSLLSPPLLPSFFSEARLPIPKGIRGPRPELPLSALTEGKTVFSFFSSLSNRFLAEVADKTRNEEQRGQMKSWGQAERLQRHLCLRLPEKACGAGEWGLATGSGI